MKGSVVMVPFSHKKLLEAINNSPIASSRTAIKQELAINMQLHQIWLFKNFLLLKDSYLGILKCHCYLFFWCKMKSHKQHMLHFMPFTVFRQYIQIKRSLSITVTLFYILQLHPQCYILQTQKFIGIAEIPAGFE